jgi:hypothetical protein
MWLLAAMAATQAAPMGSNGRGFAVIAEEARIITEKMNTVLDRTSFDGEELNKNMIIDLAFHLKLLALNAAIEAYQLDVAGKQVAVCAEEIRVLACCITQLVDVQSEENARREANPWPKNPLTSVNQSYCFLSFKIAGITVYENLDNIREVVSNYFAEKEGVLQLRKRSYPVIYGSKSPGSDSKHLYWVILQTPWAAQDVTYAVAAEDINAIYASPIGTSAAASDEMPLAKYVRECWDNKNGEPFYFMDWSQMA